MNAWFDWKEKKREEKRSQKNFKRIRKIAFYIRTPEVSDVDE